MKPLFPFLLLLTAAGRPVAAQDVTNDGGTIALTNGAVLAVPGSLTNKAGSTLSLGPGGQLRVGGNFVNAGTLVPGTGAVLLVGPAAQTLDLGGATLYDLTVDNPAAPPAVAVASNLTVTHQLTLAAGMVRTAPAATLTLPNGAALLGETATRYVAGHLRAERDAVAGTGFVDFGNGARLNPGGNALGNVAVLRTAGLQLANVSFGVNPLDPTKKSIDQVWRVLPAIQPITAVTLELTWLAASDNGLTDFTAAQLWRRNGAGWLAVGPVADASSRTLARAVSGALDQFTVSTSAAPLPVELVAFAAVRQGDAARLRWRTASEQNNEYFGVEASLDGRAFRQFARVAGRGTATAPTDYELLDPALLGYGAPVVYYRLRQVDRDGPAAYSPVAAVAVTAASFAATAAPNPVGNAGTRLRITTGTAGPAELTVTDGVGRRLLGQRTALLAGANDVPLEAAGRLAPGVYLLRVTQGPRQARLKLVRE
ncbi:T9SS type A sorting domain-containing protein [Hymenobacter sp.]|uniref:T9SS type A sorting domain-containing protein n=1 Tax=Hymenobacter sp. TaxID=1898978 RepID=UPI00286D569C|nr:T9SS type A sorting domain-containing protein [Hymenobacter sp.]